MKNVRPWALLCVAPLFVMAGAANGSNQAAEVVATAVINGAENCRNRSLLIRDVVRAKDSGMPLSQLLTIAGDDESLSQIVSNAYESDQDVNQQENTFYSTCIEDVKRQVISRMN